MLNLRKVKEILRNGPYAWPGGYPLFFIMADGEALSFDSARENWRCIVWAHLHKGCDKQWQIEAFEINWEDTGLVCAHSGQPIPCAYPED